MLPTTGDPHPTNEPDAPPHGAAVPAPPVFYRLDNTKISVIECWWNTRSWRVILAVLVLKVFRTPVPGSTDDVAVESLAEFEIFESDLPESVRQSFRPLAQELVPLGFHAPVYHAIHDVLQSTRTYLASFAHSSKPVVARLHDRICELRTPATESLFAEFITAFADGTFLWTVANKADVRAPSVCRVVRQTGAPPAELWRLHEQELARRATPAPATPVPNPAAVRVVCNRLHEIVRDFHVKRGVFAPLTQADHQRIAMARGLRRPDAPDTTKYPEILLELDRAQNKRTGLLSTIVILIVSMMVFLGVGLPGQGSFLRLLALVPILLFHECGHYLAMRVFGYRNLRMFFIPGLGAAVTGRHYNVPGWKKAIVSLMGPIPGIFIGIFLGLCGVVWDKPLAIDAAFLTLVLNGFNLLPVLPLDGGHVAHTVFFARHHIMDALFRAVAAAALVALGMLGGGRVLIFVAIAMLFALPHAFRVAKVAGELRREGFKPVSDDNQNIPPAVAETIIAKVKGATKGPTSNKVVALQTLQVFETLNTRPPGWLASLGLICVQAFSFAAAAIFVMVFLVARQGPLGDFVRNAAQAPRHRLAVSAIQRSPAPATPAGPRNTVIATYANAGAAAAAYQSAAGRLQPQERAMLLGDSVLISLPASDDARRKVWLADLKPAAADVFVDGESMRGAFRFLGIAPNEAAAQAMVDDIEPYFELPVSEGLIPPWSSVALSEDQRRARATYVRLQHAGRLDDPGMEDLLNKLGEARRQGDTAAAKELTARHRQLIADQETVRLQKIAEDESGAMDTSMARVYIELREKLKPEEFYTEVPKAFAPRLGLMGDEQAKGRGGDSCATSGYAWRSGLVVRIDSVTFRDPAAGAAALSAWLEAKGCRSLRYDVTADIGDEFPAGEGESE